MSTLDPNEWVYVVVEPESTDDFALIGSPKAVLVVNPPESRLARRVLRWLGIEWRKP